jgi:hypothetical protein
MYTLRSHLIPYVYSALAPYTLYSLYPLLIFSIPTVSNSSSPFTTRSPFTVLESTTGLFHNQLETVSRAPQSLAFTAGLPCITMPGTVPTKLVFEQVPNKSLLAFKAQWSEFYKNLWKRPTEAYVACHSGQSNTSNNRARYYYIESLLDKCESAVVAEIATETGLDRLLVECDVQELHEENMIKAMTFLKNRLRDFQSAAKAYAEERHSSGEEQEMYAIWVELNIKKVQHAFRLKDVRDMTMDHLKSFLYRVAVFKSLPSPTPKQLYLINGRRFPDGIFSCCILNDIISFSHACVRVRMRVFTSHHVYVRRIGQHQCTLQR